jgi:hypothetical protein
MRQIFLLAAYCIARLTLCELLSVELCSAADVLRVVLTGNGSSDAAKAQHLPA